MTSWDNPAHAAAEKGERIITGMRRGGEAGGGGGGAGGVTGTISRGGRKQSVYDGFEESDL
jgi:hypothetical protein